VSMHLWGFRPVLSSLGANRAVFRRHLGYEPPV